MTTTPTAGATAAPVASIETKLKADWTWFKAHLVGLVLVAALVFGAVYGVEALIARHDAATTARNEAALSALVAQTAALTQKFEADEAAAAQRDIAAQAREAADQAAYAKLAQSIIARDAQGKQQVANAATLDATQTAAAITTQIRAGAGEVVAQNDNVILDLPMSRRVNEDLITLVNTTADYNDAQTQLASKNDELIQVNTQLADSKTEIADLKTLNAGLVNQVADTANTCEQKITTLKAHQRTKLIRVALKAGAVGYVLGIGTAAALILK